MLAFYLNGLSRILHPERNNQTAAERILGNLSRSNLGTQHSETTKSSAIDSFSVTQNISDLLSPACGMTEEEKSSYMAKIMAKLKSGKRLTAEEMRFLQAENPQLYQQAARVQSMRDSLEARLSSCSSKEEAQQTYADALTHIGGDDPMKEYIVAAYDDAMKDFQKSDAYRSLPETEEDAKEKDKETGNNN